MCTPNAGIALAFGTGVAEAITAGQEAEAENAANAYRAKVLEYNAQLAEQQAVQVLQRGHLEETLYRQKVKKIKGSQRSAFAGAGVVVDQGSVHDVLTATEKTGEQDALTIRHNAALEAWALDVEAFNSRQESKLVLGRRRDPGVAAGTALVREGSKLIGVV